VAGAEALLRVEAVLGLTHAVATQEEVLIPGAPIAIPGRECQALVRLDEPPRAEPGPEVALVEAGAEGLIQRRETDVSRRRDMFAELAGPEPATPSSRSRTSYTPQSVPLWELVSLNGSPGPSWPTM
jgi:hypothetical protein